MQMDNHLHEILKNVVRMIDNAHNICYNKYNEMERS